jgi:hypothetical protein
MDAFIHEKHYKAENRNQLNQDTQEFAKRTLYRPSASIRDFSFPYVLGAVYSFTSVTHGSSDFIHVIVLPVHNHSQAVTCHPQANFRYFSN